MIACQGGKLEIFVPGPMADLVDFFEGEKSEIDVPANEICLLAYDEIVMMDRHAFSQLARPHVRNCSLLTVLV